MNKYPQVGKTGFDAVHESCPQMVYIMKELLFVTCVKLMTEIQAIESGQKDALLRRANIKKNYI